MSSEQTQSDSRAGWLVRLENVLVVTLIAALVWLFAEGRAVTTFERQMVTIQFTAPIGRDLAVEPEGELQIELDIKGSSSQIEAFNRMARAGAVPMVVDERTPSPVILRDAIAQSMLGNLGLNITRVTPATMPVVVESIESVTLPVRLVAQDAQLGPSITFDPAEVQVQLPARLLSRAPNQAVLASLEGVVLNSIVPNEPTTVEVRLRLPIDLQSAWSSMEPRTARVTFTVQRLTDTLTRQSVPVRLSVPPGILQSYRFTLDEANRVIDRVELSGPSDVIEEIRDGRKEIFAEIRPRVDDLKDGVVQLPVQIQVPPGVVILSPPMTVQVHITPLSAEP